MPDLNLDFRTHVSPVRRSSLAQAISHKLQEFIGARRLAGGERLPSERELALSLGVSRPAIREGLRLLEGLGILEVRHGKGIYVLERQSVPLTNLSQVESSYRLVLLRQAIEARRSIDVEVARVAARDCLPQDLRRIADALDAAEAEPLASRRKFALDLEFESLLGSATHNAYLMAVQRVAHQMFTQTWESCGLIPRPADERNAQHREIFAAVRSRNQALAMRRMSAHFVLSVTPSPTSALSKPKNV